MENKDLKKREKAVANDLSGCVAEIVSALKKERKYTAAHGYLCTLHSLLRYAGSEKMQQAPEQPKPARNCPASVELPSLPMCEVFTVRWLKEYQGWLSMHQYSPNTISTYMRTLQAVYRRQTPPGTPNYNPLLFKEVYTGVEAPTKRALTAEQMKRLTSTDFSALPPKQRQVLACFLLMFLLRGMPFIDLAHLRKTDLRNGRIVYRRHKTGKPIVVDLLPDATRLIQKYRDRTDSVYLFPLLDGGISDPEELYRCYQHALRRFNRELARLMKILLPGVKVSSYTARHTWATIAYHMGQPVEKISQALGHSSIRVTMAYLKPFDAEVMDKINKQVFAFTKKSGKKKERADNRLCNMGLR